MATLPLHPGTSTVGRWPTVDPATGEARTRVYWSPADGTETDAYNVAAARVAALANYSVDAETLHRLTMATLETLYGTTGDEPTPDDVLALVDMLAAREAPRPVVTVDPLADPVDTMPRPPSDPDRKARHYDSRGEIVVGDPSAAVRTSGDLDHLATALLVQADRAATADEHKARYRYWSPVGTRVHAWREVSPPLPIIAVRASMGASVAGESTPDRTRARMAGTARRATRAAAVTVDGTTYLPSAYAALVPIGDERRAGRTTTVYRFDVARRRWTTDRPNVKRAASNRRRRGVARPPVRLDDVVWSTVVDHVDSTGEPRTYVDVDGARVTLSRNADPSRPFTLTASRIVGTRPNGRPIRKTITRKGQAATITRHAARFTAGRI